MVAAHGGQGHVAAACSPRSHPLCLKSSSSRAESNFAPHDLNPGWAGSRGSVRLAPTQAGEAAGSGLPSMGPLRGPGTGTLLSFPMEEQLLMESCALHLEISLLWFCYHFICFSTPGWGYGNSPFFNLWAFSIADQALHPQSGCLLCRLHSPQLSYLVKSHSCSPFFWWHQSHPGMLWD